MDSQDIAKIIYDFHLKKLKNLEVENKKILVLFSGAPGSGKTYIAKRLEDKFQGVRFCNDDIRDIIRDEIVKLQEVKTLDTQKIYVDYYSYFFAHIPKKNGFVILDSSIDRKLGLVQGFAKQYGYKIFLIKIDLPKEILVENILKKEGKDPKPYLADLDRQLEDHKNIAPKLSLDYTITEDNFSDFEDLFAEIDRKLLQSS